MDSSSRRVKSSPRGRGRGRRSSAVDPTAMDIDPSSPQVPHTPVQPGVTMAAYIPGISGPLPPPFGAFHQQTSYIPNQSTMYGQFAYNIPPNPHVIHNVHPTPQPTHPNTNQSQENIGSGESEAQSSHGSTRAKTWIEPDGNGSIRFLPNDGAVSRISLIFQSKFDGAWPTWSKVPKPVRDLWFGEFKKWFTWDPIHEDRMRRNFENRGNAHLRDFFGKARKHNKKPVWLGDAQWEGLQQHWANEHYKKLRETAQKNRLGTPESGGPSLHTCGSIPMHEHRRRLREQLGTEPTIVELFSRTHKLQGKEDAPWVDKKSQQTYETFERDFQNVINSQGSGDGSSKDPNQPFPNPNELWVKTFKNKKGRIYGIGDEAVNMRGSGYFSPTQRSGSGSMPSQQELNELRGVVNNLGGELSSQAESYRLVMEKCKQLEESNRLLTQSNQQLSQQMMSIDQRLQAFFQMQQASGSGSQPPFTHPSQHHEEDGEEEEEEEEEEGEEEEEEEDLGD